MHVYLDTYIHVIVLFRGLGGVGLWMCFVSFFYN